MGFKTKITEFEEHLCSAEYAPGTIDKYLRNVRSSRMRTRAPFWTQSTPQVARFPG